MGHAITALIGPSELVESMIDEMGLPRSTPLPFGLSIVPLGHAALDRISEDDLGSVAPDFNYLGSGLETALRAASADGVLLYIETNYFGGIGGQGAALFRAGESVWKEAQAVSPTPPAGKSPISRGLECLGVTASDGQDEFDTLGLSRYRSLESLGLDEYEDGD